MKITKLKQINNQWFFKELPPYIKVFSFFVRGDLIFLLPLVVIILLTGFLSTKFMLIMVGAYIIVRNLGEMIYWFAHQFYERKYRPPDFGFKNLDNHAIYILYQTLAISWVMIGIGICTWTVMFVK